MIPTARYPALDIAAPLAGSRSGAMRRWAQWRRRLPSILLLCLLVYLAVLVLSLALFSSPGYDDAWYGSVARNFAAGRGYVTAYGESVKEFDPQITTGPPALAPSSILFGLFGNRYWAANLGVALIAFPLLAATVWLMLRSMRVPAGFIVAIAVAVVVFSNERDGNGEIYRFMFLWSHLMGEIPAVTLTIAAGAVVSVAGPRWRLHFLAGTLLALGVYSKLFVVWFMPGLFLLFAHGYFLTRDPRPFIAFCAGGVLVALFSEAFRLALLGSIDAYVDNTRAVINFYRGWDNGLPDTSSFNSALRMLDLSIPVLAPLALWAAYLMYEQFREPARGSSETARLRFAFLLLTAALVHSIWWWLINDAGWSRHLVPALVYASFGLGVLGSLSRKPLVIGAGLAAFVVVLMPQSEVLRDVEPITHREERLVALLHTSDFVRDANDGNTSFWGCGWWANRDVYLVSDVRMYDCSNRASVAAHLAEGDRLLQVRSEFYNWEGNADFATLAGDCDTRALFREGPFVVCDATPYLASKEIGPSVSR